MGEVSGSAGAAPAGSGCRAEVVVFDFAARQCRVADLAAVAGAIGAGLFVWIDLDADGAAAGRTAVGELRLLPEPLLEDLFQAEAGTQLARFPEGLHLVVSGLRIDDADVLALERVDVVIGERFLITGHQGPRTFLEAVRRDYRSDFERFAQSPSFLVYELLDNLTEHYVAMQKKIERRVDRLQADMMVAVDDPIFERMSALGSDLLHFRSVLTPARTVFTELATRRSIFISEATQPFIANMVSTLERVLQDVLVDRDLLAQSLNLHMSMVSHRTGQAMNKLTVISTIFLPLTFLCGVYGMNFEVLPELKWRYGYLLFWVITGALVGGLLYVMRRARLL